MPRYTIIRATVFLLLTSACGQPTRSAEPASIALPADDHRILAYTVDPTAVDLRFYWNDETDERYASLGKLQRAVSARGDSLLFAVNGGMYDKERAPQGLYVEDGRTLMPIDTAREGYGNFYLQPNGVFALRDDGRPLIVRTTEYATEGVRYATQSGPLLVTGGELHPAFNEGSANVHYRNGVGVLPDGRLLFATSTEKINFFDFATYFRRKGCRDALYLDGYVSRTWWPAGGVRQRDGDFGVIIGVSAPK